MSGLERHRHEAAVELANCTHEMGRLERTLDSRMRGALVAKVIGIWQAVKCLGEHWFGIY